MALKNIVTQSVTISGQEVSKTVKLPDGLLYKLKLLMAGKITVFEEHEFTGAKDIDYPLKGGRQNLNCTFGKKHLTNGSYKHSSLRMQHANLGRGAITAKRLMSEIAPLMHIGIEDNVIELCNNTKKGYYCNIYALNSVKDKK